jgi:hypothetical protein
MPDTQCRTANVGPSGDYLKQITVPFSPPSELTVIPRVVATPLQDPKWPGVIPDTFAVTITGVSETGFTANIYRVDGGPGWGQDLFLTYIACGGAFPVRPGT